MSKWEKFASVINIALGVFIAFYSYYYLKLGIMISPGAGFLPFFLGIALIVLGVLWFFTASLSKSSPKAHDGKSACADGNDSYTEAPLSGRFPKKLLLGLIVIVVYAWLFEKLGYFLSTLLFMLGWQILVEREKWIKTIIVTVACTAAMYTLFKFLLGIQLPACAWFSWGGI